MFAVYLAMANKYVDIISSSAVLAREIRMNGNVFYDLFKLSSGSNLTQTTREERLESYGKRIIYGTVSSFASDT
jgi:preprotein translocase subunit SecA